MSNKNINKYILSGIFLISALGVLFLLYPKQRADNEDDVDRIVLREIQSIDVGYLIGPEDGRRTVFGRYHLIDNTGTYSNVGSEGNINISQDNTRTFLTYPDGTREEITSELWYFPLRIIPPLPSGTYKLTFVMNSGETFSSEIDYMGATEVGLVAQDIVRTQEKPDIGPDLTSEEIDLYSELGRSEYGGDVQWAFALSGVDLRDADVAYYIDKEGVPYGGELPMDNIDEYFWLDTDKIKQDAEEDAAWEKFRAERRMVLSSEEISALSEKEYDSLFGIATLKNRHIFMARVGGEWYYAWAIYPNDFE